MEYSELNLGSWASYLGRFKDLLRPDGLGPSAELDEHVESARGEDSARISLATITNTLPDLVFEGYSDWYTNQDEWVLRHLGHVLDTQEEHEILVRLDQGTSESLGELLGYVADERLTIWQNAARAEFTETASESAAGILSGAANTANWQASRTPGTFYYTHSDDRYLYSDLSEGPISEWETLPIREQLATDNAQPWGNEGWFYTPTGTPDLYGGAYVYAADRDGPWVTEDQARSRIDALTVVELAAQQRYHPVEPVSGHAGWYSGYDTEARAWKFAPASGSEVPGDEAAWAEINTFRADDTEYFAGPGYSESGWVPYEALPQAELESSIDTPTEQLPAEQVSVEQRQLAAQTVRAEVVGPALSQVVSQFREKLPADLVARIGPELESLAERLVVAQTAKLLAGAQPTGIER
jgi:hypothetical protein